MELMVVFPGPGSWRGVDWQEVNFHVWGNCSKGIQWGGYLGSIRMKGTGHKGGGRFQAHGTQNFQNTFGNGCE